MMKKVLHFKPQFSLTLTTVMWSEFSKQEVEVIEMKNSHFRLVLCEIISFNVKDCVTAHFGLEPFKVQRCVFLWLLVLL